MPYKTIALTPPVHDALEALKLQMSSIARYTLTFNEVVAILIKEWHKHQKVS